MKIFCKQSNSFCHIILMKQVEKEEEAIKIYKCSTKFKRD